MGGGGGRKRREKTDSERELEISYANILTTLPQVTEERNFCEYKTLCGHLGFFALGGCSLAGK